MTATAGNRSATISWAPGSDGGSPISSYAVTINGGAQVIVQGNPLPTSTTVTGLANNAFYTFTVSATNALGTGPASVPSNQVAPGGPPLGNPVNTRGTALTLPSLACGSGTSASASGMTGNDGSEAWYVVTFSFPTTALSPGCTLHIDLTGVGGAGFDVYRGTDTTPFATHVITAAEASPAFGTSETLFIRVYYLPRAVPGDSDVSGNFNLVLNVV